ncbi:hypothetical protein PG991_001559 [Apiospora marii]|uniref:Uncharacterized protein n=1 Tax=Apiospora marii TaxID=335849 RepID=A0ABR1SQ13_9PEZI
MHQLDPTLLQRRSAANCVAESLMDDSSDDNWEETWEGPPMDDDDGSWALDHWDLVNGRDQPPSRPCYCEPRCTYCSFPIEEGDMAVAAPAQFTDRVSAPFAWAEAGVEWIDDSLGADFRWPVERKHVLSEIPGWHEPCFRFGTDRLGMRRGREIHDASRYGHAPDASHDRQRFVRLQGELAPLVRAQFPALPFEICLIIAGYLVPEYAICLLDNLWGMHATRYLPIQVSLESDIWARFVTVENTKYIAGLANAPASGHSTKIYKGRPNDGSAAPAMVMTLEDHLGVRVLLSSSSTRSNLRRWQLSPVEGQVMVRLWGGGSGGGDGMRLFCDPGFLCLQFGHPKGIKLRANELRDGEIMDAKEFQGLLSRAAAVSIGGSSDEDEWATEDEED